MTALPLLECKELSKAYTKGGGNALSDVNLSINAGRIVGLLGPNGSGKTTLIKLINGLLVPSAGQVLINGAPPAVESKRIVSYLSDKPNLAEWMRVEQMLNFFADFYEDFDKARALDMLTQLQIQPTDVYKTLSKGTQEKVRLVLVMSRRAKLYVLDEPIGGVDPAARDYILRTIITNYEEDATVIIATHLIADIESVLDEVIFISQGTVTLHDTVDNIRQQRGKSVDELFREVFAC